MNWTQENLRRGPLGAMWVQGAGATLKWLSDFLTRKSRTTSCGDMWTPIDYDGQQIGRRGWLRHKYAFGGHLRRIEGYAAGFWIGSYRGYRVLHEIGHAFGQTCIASVLETTPQPATFVACIGLDEVPVQSMFHLETAAFGLLLDEDDPPDPPVDTTADPVVEPCADARQRLAPWMECSLSSRAAMRNSELGRDLARHYIGSYAHPAYGVVEVEYKNASAGVVLNLKYGKVEGELIPNRTTEFYPDTPVFLDPGPWRRWSRLNDTLFGCKKVPVDFVSGGPEPLRARFELRGAGSACVAATESLSARSLNPAAAVWLRRQAYPKTQGALAWWFRFPRKE